MKKLKLKMWSQLAKKVKIQLENRVIKLREERQLLSRFLIVLGSCPQLVPKLNEVIGNFEMSVVPRSLVAVDGTLHIPADKSSLMKMIEGDQSKKFSPNTRNKTNATRILIVDAMEVLKGITKTSKMTKILHLQEEFIKRISRLLHGYDEGRIVFDKYVDESLKNKTRMKRSQTTAEFAIHPEMSLTMSIKELLSASSTKRSLTIMIANATLNHFIDENQAKIVVVYDDKIVKGECRERVELHTHEEADTLIPYQVLACIDEQEEDKALDIDVTTPDTDVITYCADVDAKGLLKDNVSLSIITGKNTKSTCRRVVDVRERVKALGSTKAKALIGLHNFTGADWGGKFVGISKQKWCDAFMKLPDESPVLESLSIMGETHIPGELQNAELPLNVAALEPFVCSVYSTNGPKNLPELRWELFRTKNREGEMLPPTRASLLPHIIRCNYISRRDKSYTPANPVLPPIEENGWNLEQGIYTPVMCLNLPAPKAVIELVKCSCIKGGCSGNNIAILPGLYLYSIICGVTQ